MDTQLGYWRWKFFRWNEHPNPYRNRPDLAQIWLNQFKDNSSAMAELQVLLNNSATGAYVTTDPSLVLQQMAEKMATGEIQVCVEVCGPVALKSVALIVPDEVEPELSRLTATPAPAPSPAPEPPQESTFGPNNDPVCQAQSLKKAAEEGAPFCEECEKAAQAQRKQANQAGAPTRAAITEVQTLGPNADEIAQAKALKDAAQKGSPFCEECEKARQANQTKNGTQPQTTNNHD
jgi:hypothetical protein